MRAIEPVESSTSASESVDSVVVFFGPYARQRQIQQKQASHVPRRFDPLAALIWLIVAPLACFFGWYGFIRAVMALWGML
jgi:hypothetical protein